MKLLMAASFIPLVGMTANKAFQRTASLRAAAAERRMKTNTVLRTMVMAFTLFSGGAAASGEEAFWKWFVKNEPRLFSFEGNQEAIFAELGERMERVHGDLTFEFGPVHDGKREFVISAGGIKAAFPAVEALHSKAPSLPRWTWVKYRPRRLPLNDIDFGGKSVKVDDVRYLLAKDGDKVGVLMFFDGYNEKEKATFGQIGYLFLDEALGEHSVETEVGFIEFFGRNSKHFARSRPLRELAAHFDEQLGRITH
jgi:hypothetical protein